MTTSYNQNYQDTYPFSDTGAKLALAANTELTWTVPGTETDKYRALFAFNSTANIWVALNNTATVPAAGTVSNTYMQELRPHARYVQGGDVLHFISSAIAECGVTLLKIPA